MERVHSLRQYYDIIDQGTGAEKAAKIPDFPRILEFELTNHCNMHCIMCETGLEISGRPRGFMPDTLYHKILDELDGKDCPIKFVGVGESLLHPNAVSYICEAVDRGHICHLTTNGSLLSEAVIERFIEAGLQSIKFSFQGVTRQGYQEMRRVDYFEKLYETMKLFYKKRGEKQYPYMILATTVTDESTEEIQAFRHRFGKYCDKVEVGQTTFEFLDLSQIKDLTLRKKLAQKKEKHTMKKVRWSGCPHVFDTLTVHWNGTVTVCCADHCDENILGNLTEQTLSYLWTCEKEQQFRKILAENRYEDIPLCSRCYNYMGY